MKSWLAVTKSNPSADIPKPRRRQLISSVAGAALLARVPMARAATYDLIIKGGRVIDPCAGLRGPAGSADD